ncbi:unnamed protein product [Amoebophrya sp. A25]|nr:unnamed protein product [Amoebophrya sp. A25]|eukprot:GSA25T00005392001.1
MTRLDGYGEWIRDWALINAEQNHPCEQLKSALLAKQQADQESLGQQGLARASNKKRKDKRAPGKDAVKRTKGDRGDLEKLAAQCGWTLSSPRDDLSDRLFSLTAWNNAADAFYPASSIAGRNYSLEYRMGPTKLSLNLFMLAAAFLVVVLFSMDLASIACGYSCGDSVWVHCLLCRCQCCCRSRCCAPCYKGLPDAAWHCRCLDRTWWDEKTSGNDAWRHSGGDGGSILGEPVCGTL